MKSRIITLGVFLIALGFVISLTRSVYDLWRRGDVVEERALVRNQLKAENEALKEELENVESSDYIEEQARNKLNLSREGEVIVVLPPFLTSPEPIRNEKKSGSKPNWQLWRDRFF